MSGQGGALWGYKAENDQALADRFGVTKRTIKKARSGHKEAAERVMDAIHSQGGSQPVAAQEASE